MRLLQIIGGVWLIMLMILLALVGMGSLWDWALAALRAMGVL